MRAGPGVLVRGAALALLARAAAADVFVVNTNLDNAGGLCPANPTSIGSAIGSCSLRSAITASNGSTGPSQIVFAPLVFSTTPSKLISVATPLPNLTTSVEINAVSTGLVTQRVQGIVVSATGTNTTLFGVASGVAQLNDLTLLNGDVGVLGLSR